MMTLDLLEMVKSEDRSTCAHGLKEVGKSLQWDQSTTHKVVRAVLTIPLVRSFARQLALNERDVHEFGTKLCDAVLQKLGENDSVAMGVIVDESEDQAIAPTEFAIGESHMLEQKEEASNHTVIESGKDFQVVEDFLGKSLVIKGQQFYLARISQVEISEHVKRLGEEPYRVDIQISYADEHITSSLFHTGRGIDYIEIKDVSDSARLADALSRHGTRVMHGSPLVDWSTLLLPKIFGKRS